MKITIIPPEDGQEDEIIIKCSVMSEELLKFVSSLSSERSRIAAHSDDGITMLSPEEIFYFEAVDNRVFAYCEKSVFEVKLKLYETEELPGGNDFLRISKSVVVNVSKIVKISPTFNGRLEARLENGEKTVISRQYVSSLKKKLGIQ